MTTCASTHDKGQHTKHMREFAAFLHGSLQYHWAELVQKRYTE